MKRTAGAELEEHRRARRTRETAINRGLRELDAAGALAMLQQLCDRWKLTEDGRTLTFEQQTMRMFQQFGMDYRDNMLDALDVDRGSFGLRALDDRINEAEIEAIGLYHRLHELGLLPETQRRVGEEDDDDGPDPAAAGDADPDKQSALQRIVKVLEMVYYAKRVVLSAFQAKLAVHQLHNGDGALDLAADLDARLGSWALRFRYIDKTNPLQNLLLYLLDGAMEKRYRKSNGWMYEPIYLDGQHMHAWRPVVEIKDFVYSLLHKETCWEQWCNATASGMKNVSAAIEYLTNCQDYQLPELRKQQGVYAFRNGVYLCETDTFHDLEATQERLSEDVVACKYFDTDFDHFPELEDWRDVPTPHLQSILDHQKFEPEVCDWAYTLLGRLLYPLNKLDSWQVIPFFKGKAASGKCVAFGTLTLMYDGTSRPVQDIAVGDLVMGDDGTPRRVLTLARGEDELFTLKPKRAAFPELTVTREHVLCLKYTNQGSVAKWKYGKLVNYFDPVERKAKAKKFTKDDEFEAFCATVDRHQVFEMTLEEYLAVPDYTKRYLVCYRVPVDFAVTEEPLFDPWAIGVWLGDGHSEGSRMTIAEAELVTEVRRVVADRGLSVVPSTSSKILYGISQQDGARTKQGNAFLQALKIYGLQGNKHVPLELKTGTRETRMDLLAGLLDTDGWKNPGGYYEITQKREVLADDIVFLARSLGFGATKTEVKKAAVKRAREGEACDEDGKVRAWGTYYRVNIFGAGLEDIPLRCARKRFAPGELKHAKDALKWGFTVEPAGRGPYYGFQTDGNERFVLGDFTVTHNSTIVLKVCKAFYEPMDVGVLSNNIERKFGLSAFYDKKIFVAPEVKGDLACEQAEFQSVVSGEDLQVNVKHKKAFATTWMVPGALAGNEVPQWADNSGSVQRRVILFEFGRSVVNGDMKLGEKLEREMPRILLKCNRAYLEQVARNSSVNIWTILPEYFKKTRDMLAQSVNSVEAFLASEEIIHGDDLYMPMEDFRNALKAFEMTNNFKSKRYDYDFFKGPFDKFGLNVVRAKRSYRGHNKTRDYVLGIDLNDAQENDNDLT